ncbi:MULTISPECIES: YetF domain-containing protein [unclassified Paenibacillus]|uniref:DUF421 domain-containing protein n=1 Tax=unclassified Paenibacillus TaxID=185978 RepID=UPI00104B62A5|nr:MULTISPECIES: YetF domain-containing protein [unclassified Paenibacillus]NIK69201.1 uncharacterized membrane protein YcaP (DUF421 family) [Paenibacillus sp. BK720]TCM92843.1 uncharacterized protein DUF421 [Paenibacillus sp. BK033]
MLYMLGLAFLFAAVSIILLRLAGRKSISQMTMPQLGILLTIGAIMGSEVSGKGALKTIAAAAVFVLVLVGVEWLTLKSNTAERLLKGFAVPVIENGEVITNNLRKLRISVDDLEKRLRMHEISAFQDVKSATIEVNGELGYELYPHAKPATIRDIESLLRSYFPQAVAPPAVNSGSRNLFAEVSTPHKDEVPDQLQ